MDAFAHTMAKKIHDADADVAMSCLPPLMYSFAKLQMPGLVEFTNTFKVRVIAFLPQTAPAIRRTAVAGFDAQTGIPKPDTSM